MSRGYNPNDAPHTTMSEVERLVHVAWGECKEGKYNKPSWNALYRVVVEREYPASAPAEGPVPCKTDDDIPEDAFVYVTMVQFGGSNEWSCWNVWATDTEAYGSARRGNGCVVRVEAHGALADALRGPPSAEDAVQPFAVDPDGQVERLADYLNNIDAADPSKAAVDQAIELINDLRRLTMAACAPAGGSAPKEELRQAAPDGWEPHWRLVLSLQTVEDGRKRVVWIDEGGDTRANTTDELPDEVIRYVKSEHKRLSGLLDRIVRKSAVAPIPGEAVEITEQVIRDREADARDQLREALPILGNFESWSRRHVGEVSSVLTEEEPSPWTTRASMQADAICLQLNSAEAQLRRLRVALGHEHTAEAMVRPPGRHKERSEPEALHGLLLPQPPDGRRWAVVDCDDGVRLMQVER